MFQPFFATAMRARTRQLTFRRVAGLHVVLLTVLAGVAARTESATVLAGVGQFALVLGIVEGASLIGWRLTQLPRSLAFEFLLVSPIQPRRVFLAEALVGVSRFALVCLAGLPVWLLAVLVGAIAPEDLGPLLLAPFVWGTATGLGLTVWAYESPRVRRVGEVVGLCGVLVYLVVGILAGEKLRLWLAKLPDPVAEAIYLAIMTIHEANPFGVMRNWFELRNGPQATGPTFARVSALAVGLSAAFALRAALRLKRHFQERHYQPLRADRVDQSGLIGDRPLTWWAVRRVMEYSGRVNVWLAGGFCLLYGAYLVAGDRWPPWLGRLPFLIFERLGGAPVVATAICVLATVPAVFQYGLWDATVSERCRRLELLLLTDLNSRDYWSASLAAAWKRGRAYLYAAGVLWVALAVSERVTGYEALAAAFGGLVLWVFSFAVGFRAFCTGNQASGLASLMIFGLPLVLSALVRAEWYTVAAFVPPAVCYLPLKVGITTAWADGLVLLLIATWWLTHSGLVRCDGELRRWYDANQGRKTE
jgi:hypothetical protein